MAAIGHLKRSAVVAIIAVLAMMAGLASARPGFADTTYLETTGGPANTWTNYTNAGGTQGPTIGGFTGVQIACRLTGFTVADGNNWWYLIASSPWSYNYYVSADPFYNNGATSGSLHGTPFYDPNVPVCGSGGGTAETTGGAANTWTNYTNAGGTQGPTIGGFSTVNITCRLTGFTVADGNNWWYQIGSSPWNNGFYVSADAFYNNGSTSGSLRGTPFYDPNVPLCSAGGGGGSGFTNETIGGSGNTWTNYTNAGGTQGPTIAAYTTLAIACKVTGFRVADGNTWWYQVAASPWNSQYYVSADAFYNNGATSGSLIGTPYVDPAVPDCASGTRPSGETAGGAANTWTNYTNAGGLQGPTVSAGQTIQVACRVTGFVVSDKNSWWYLISASPWNGVYYVSADAFYNNGATSGSLAGTPFYDPAVPVCTNAPIAPTHSTAYGSSSASVNHTGCINGYYPVDCASGDFWHTFTDISVAGRGPGLKLTRTYNDLAASKSGLFGLGWTSSYDAHLVSDSDGSATITMADGSQIVAQAASGGGFALPGWADSSLTPNGNSYTLRQNATASRPALAYTFNSNGSLSSLADLNGNATTFQYTGSQLVSVTDAAGRTVALTNDGNGRITTATDPAGNTTHYAYNSAGDLTAVTDPAGHVTNFGYDSSNRMLTMTDPNGAVITNTYDSSGRVVSQTDGAGLTTTYAYTGDNFSALGGTTTITDPHGSVELQQYANGFLSKLTKAVGTSAAAAWTYTYDQNSFGLTSVTDPNGKTTSRTYNSAGEILTATDATGAVTTTTYNALGEPLTVTDPLTYVSSKTYDGSGNLLTTTDQNGHTTTYTYGDASHPGDVTSVTDPDGRVTNHTYDSNGNVATTTTTPSSGTSNTTHDVSDQDGRVVCTASAIATAAGISCGTVGSAHVSGTTFTTYDQDGHPVTVVDALGNTTTNAYDADENLTSVIDGAGHVTTHTYDGDQRILTTTTGATGSAPSTVGNRYDVAPGSNSCPSTAGISYCTEVVNPNTSTTIQAYDAAGNEAEAIQPDHLQTTTYSYDLAGNKLTMTAADGRTTSYSYDNDYRLTAIHYDDGSTPNVSLGYDQDGRRTTMSDGTGTTTYSYDHAGRTTSVTNGAGAVVSYAYDGAGNVTNLTYPNGNGVARHYDAAGRLTSLTDWLANTTSFSYDANGNLTSTHYANGDSVTGTYDATDRLTTTNLVGASGNLATIGYQRNGSGQITQEADGGALTGTTNYSYDSSGRVTGAGSSTYGYDVSNNLTGYAAATQAFNTDTEVTSSTTGSTTTSYTYDSRGNRTQASAPGSAPTLAIDATTSKDGTTSNATLISNAFSTTHAGDILIALVGSDGPATGTETETVSGAGLTWSLVSRANTQKGDAEIWSATASTALTNVTVQTKQQTAVPHQTLTVVALTGAGGVGASGHAAAATGAPTINLTTTAAGSLVFGVGDDWDNATAHPVGSGQTMIHQLTDTGTGDDYWAQRTTNPVATTGTSVTINSSSPTTDQWNLAAVEITPATASGSSTTNYTYDEANRLTSSAPTGSASTSYRYDGNGLRQSKTTGSTTTNFTWDTTASTQLLLSDGNTNYLYGPGGLPIEQISSTGTAQYYFHDAIGSTRALTAQTGAVTSTTSYNPYGQVSRATGTAGAIGYAGGYADTETGFLYLINRYYDPSTSVFVTVDPLLKVSGSAYGYASADPVNGTDRTGLFGFQLCFIICGGYSSGNGPAVGFGSPGASFTIGQTQFGLPSRDLGGSSVCYPWSATDRCEVSLGVGGNGVTEIQSVGTVSSQPCVGLIIVSHCGVDQGSPGNGYRQPNPLPWLQQGAHQYDQRWGITQSSYNGSLCAPAASWI